MRKKKLIREENLLNASSVDNFFEDFNAAESEHSIFRFEVRKLVIQKPIIFRGILLPFIYNNRI